MATIISGDSAGVHTSAAVECLQTIAENYTISAGYNAGFFGPVTVAQDVAFQRALESGADTSTIVAEKQRLRDVTKLADAATTLDELKALVV